MASGLVLVIEDDEWVSRLLVNAIRDAGYGVLACATAKEGFETACAEEPSAIVCDVELPDGDGFWVARSIRAEVSPVSTTPFIFLTGLDDSASRMEGFQVGADVYITKPFRIQEVVAQIDALVQMAERMRRQMEMQGRIPALDSRDSDFGVSDGEDGSPVSEAMSIPAPKGSLPVTAIEGDLSQMSVATVLTVLEMERRTGMFEVLSKKRRAQLEIVGGAVVEGKIGGTRVKAVTTLRTMLGWKVGRFSFTPMAEREPPADRKSISAFLLEATRLEDEAMRDELDLPPSKRSSALGSKLSAPALGGQSSADDLLGPMSSRNSFATPVPSSTMPIARPLAHAREDIFGDTTAARTVPTRASGRRISEPPPEPATGVQNTMELEDIEPISAAPTGTSGVGSGGSRPVFPGLSGIGGGSRPQKAAAAPKPAAAPPPRPPPPLPREQSGPGFPGARPGTVSTPPPTPPHSSTPPPLPKRDFVPPRPPAPPARGTSVPPPARPPPPLPLPRPDPTKKR